MAGHFTMKRDGGWTIELVTPLKRNDGTLIESIELRPMELDQVIRWGQGEVPSTLAMLAEMCDVPEPLLRSLSGADVTRVLLAYSQIIDPAVRKDFEEGTRPFSTPSDQIPEDQRAAPAGAGDPRFPKVPGPIRRFETVPSPSPEEEDDSGGVNMTMPGGAQRVG